MKRKKDSREEITLIGFVDPLDDDDDVQEHSPRHIPQQTEEQK